VRILCIDVSSNALDWLMRCQSFGHQVKWYDRNRKDGSVRQAGEGIVPKIRDYDELRRKWLDWADLIFTPDNTHYLELLEPLRERGYPVFGPSPAAAALELDRTAGQAAIKEAGMNVIPSKEFRDHDAAIAYVKKHADRCFVSKPNNDDNKAMSYVATDAADLVYMLERWKKNEAYRQGARENGFILQDKIDGIEMAVGGWFGPGGWSQWWCENWEFKKLMNGDLGVNTGEQGTLVRYVKQSKLADLALKPLTKILKRLGYVGYIDNNVMIGRDKIWPMELTVRHGWPLTHNQTALHQGCPAQWMKDLIDGRDTLDVIPDKPCVSVVVTIPDFPYSRYTAKETTGIPVYGATDREHIHLSEVMFGEAPTLVGNQVVSMPCYLTAGDYVLIATGVGDTISGARRSAYAAVKKVKIPNSPMWRTDIGAGRLVKQIPELQKLGYAKGLTF